MYTAVCIIYIYRYLYTYTCLCIYISASRKLRLQRSAVYCLSWLFFFFSFLPIFFLRIRFSLFSSPFSQPVSSSSFHPCLTLSISFPRPFSLFFFRLSKILQHLSSSEANTRPRVHHQLSRFRRFLFPLVRRGWQFRGMSHRGAASRTNRSLVLAILKKTSLFLCVFFCSFVLSFLFRTFSFYRSCAFSDRYSGVCIFSQVRLAGETGVCSYFFKSPAICAVFRTKHAGLGTW